MLARIPIADYSGLQQLRAQQSRISAEKLVLEESLPDFFRAAWQVLQPRYPLIWSWHYSLICEYLSLIRAGKFHQHYPEAAGLIVNVPPRTAKSTLITVCYPVWCWLKDPARRFMCASYSAGLSRDHSIMRRDLIRSPWFQERWGKLFEFKADVNQAEHFANSRTGEMIAVSVGGTAMGQGGDDLILDDPLDPDQAASDAERKRVNDWIDNTLKGRLNNPAAGLIILVMQRLHELDPTGKLLAEGSERWIHVKIPTLCEEKTVYSFPISKREVTRAEGDVVLPDRFPARVLRGLQMNRLVWAGQHQQRPAPLEGNMIRRVDVRYYGGTHPVSNVPDPPLPDKFDFVIVSTDCPFKDFKTSDFVGSVVIGVKGPNRYVLDAVQQHLDAERTEALILRQRIGKVGQTSYKASTVLVENAAAGPGVIALLRQKIPGVIAVDPRGGKIVRMYAVSGEWQSGNWYVDRAGDWTESFLSQILAFPNAAHDDMVDGMTQAGCYLQSKGQGLVGFWKQRAEELGALQFTAQKPPDSKELADSQKRETDAWPEPPMQMNQGLGKVATAKEQTDICPECGNKFLNRYQNLIKCGACGWSETLPLNGNGAHRNGSGLAK